MNKTQQLKEAISEYVEDVECDICDGKGYYLAGHIEATIICDTCNETGCRKITLEDVLIALDKSDSRSFMLEKLSEFINDWKLNQPLENQSEETKQFLFEILIKGREIN